MVGLADLKRYTDNLKACQMNVNNKYCYFYLSGLSTFDFLDILNYKSWVYKTYQRTVTVRYVNLIKKLERGNAIVRTSIGFGPLLLRFLRIKGYQVRDQDIDATYRSRLVVYPDLKINLYDFQQRMISDWMNAGAIGVIKSATGSGKTILGCRAIKEIGRKTLILVHTSDLLINVWNDSLLKSFGPGIMSQVGIVGGGLTDSDRMTLKIGARTGDFEENIKKDIVVATFQTLNNRLDQLTQYKFGLMIVDECIPIDSEIWTQDGIIKYEDLSLDKGIYQIWSRNGNDDVTNNGYKKIKTRFKHMYRTVVESGDEIVCSLDHKVLSIKKDEDIDYIEIEKARNIAKSLIKPYDNREDCIWARIFGYMLGDGHIYVSKRNNKYVKGYAIGDYKGLLRMLYDIKKLNYKSYMSDEKFSESKIHSLLYGELEVIGSAYHLILESDLTRKLIDLGCPSGKKTDKIYYIPKWIMEGNRDIKREFVAAYIGAEGTNPYSICNEENTLNRSFGSPKIVIYKRADLLNEGLKFAGQIKQLLYDIGIEVVRIDVTDGNLRKDGTISKRMDVVLSGQRDNLKRCLDLGSRYCWEKEAQCEILRLYLKYIEKCIEERKELGDIVYNIKRGIVKPSSVANIVNEMRLSEQKDITSSWEGLENRDTINKKYLIRATPGIISDILYPHNRRDGSQMIAKSVKVKKSNELLSFEEWKNKVKGDFIFLDIIKHEYRGYEQGYTLTVNKDHNYMVNGFNIANCHHVPSQMFRKVNAVIRAPYKMGLSATTKRLDGLEKEVFGQLGDIQSSVTIRELINKGILAEPRFQSPIIVDNGIIEEIENCGYGGLNLSRFVKKKSASSTKKKDYIVNICKNIAARDRKFLLFTDYVNAEDVYIRDMYAESLLKDGVKVSIIDQEMSSDERSTVFKLLDAGEISGIVFGKLGSEGINILNVDAVIMANGIKSPITYCQRVGRAMRKTPNKQFCDIYEILLDTPMELKWSEFNFMEYRNEGFTKLTYKVE